MGEAGSMARALIVKFGAIGDVIMDDPRSLRIIPARRSTGSAARPSAPLLACYPWIETIVIDDRALLTGSKLAQIRTLAALWKTLSGRRYDLCATLYYDPPLRPGYLPHSRRAQGHPVAYQSRSQAPARPPSHRRVRPHPARHQGRRARNLARSRTAPGPAPVTHPASAGAGTHRARARRRPQHDARRRSAQVRGRQIRNLAYQLLAQGLSVLLIGGPDDLWAASAFAGLQVTDRIGKLSLIETLSILEDSDVLVTMTPGPLHLGGITSAGVVSIFGPTDPGGRIPQRRRRSPRYGAAKASPAAPATTAATTPPAKITPACNRSPSPWSASRSQQSSSRGAAVPNRLA